MKARCSGFMGKVFGHQFINYGSGEKVSTTAACLYLHIHFKGKHSIPVPKAGSLCTRCGLVTWVKK